jgi:hypothetical protein
MPLTKKYLHNCSCEHLYKLRDNRLLNIEYEKDINIINSLKFELTQILIEIKKRH